MADRLSLGDTLVAILKNDNVYFQPPESIRLSYPCIIYELTDIDTTYADNRPYRIEKAYQILVIDKNPDTTLPDEVAKLPNCRFTRYYTADNLNHYVFIIYW